MPQIELKNVAVRSAGELCQRLKISDDAKKLLKEQATPAEYLSKLLEANCLQDAVHFLGHGLPKRLAISWALSCAKEVGGPSPANAPGAAIAQVEKWLSSPNEENRRAAKKAADEAGLGTPAGCTALAVFFSGGSMGPADAPPVAPGEAFSASAAVGAILLAAVAQKPQEAPTKLRKFIARGIELANGPAK